MSTSSETAKLEALLYNFGAATGAAAMGADPQCVRDAARVLAVEILRIAKEDDHADE